MTDHMQHTAENNNDILQCKNDNYARSGEIILQGIVGTIAGTTILGAAEVITEGGVLVAIGLTPTLPALVGVATTGIALTYTAAYLSEKDCQKIADRMNNIAAQQPAPELSPEN